MQARFKYTACSSVPFTKSKSTEFIRHQQFSYVLGDQSTQRNRLPELDTPIWNDLSQFLARPCFSLPTNLPRVLQDPILAPEKPASLCTKNATDFIRFWKKILNSTGLYRFLNSDDDDARYGQGILFILHTPSHEKENMRRLELAV